MSVPYRETVITGNDGRRAAAPGNPVLRAGLGAACISASGILVQLAGAGAATTALFRCVLALPLLAALAVREQRRLGPRALRSRLGAVAAGLALSADLVLWNHAIAAVGAGIATVLGNLQVVFVALAAWLLFGERPHRRFLLLLPVVLAGVVLVSGLAGPHAAGLRPAAGVVYGVATSIAYAAFLLILRQTSTASPHVAGPLAEATAGAAGGALVLGLLFGSLQLAPGWHAFWWLLILAISSQTMGWLLITSSLPVLPAAVASLLLLLQPAAAMLLAAVVLGERPSALQIAGAAVVCGGILAASRVPGGGREAAGSAAPEAAAAAEPPSAPAAATDPVPAPRRSADQARSPRPGTVPRSAR